MITNNQTWCKQNGHIIIIIMIYIYIYTENNSDLQYVGEKKDMVQKGKCLTIFFERVRKGHHKSHRHWNCFKGNVRGTFKRWGGANKGFSGHTDTILN